MTFTPEELERSPRDLLIEAYLEANDRCRRIVRACHAAGISGAELGAAERVSRVEQEGQRIAELIRRLLAGLELSPEQQDRCQQEIPKFLRDLPPP